MAKKLQATSLLTDFRSKQTWKDKLVTSPLALFAWSKTERFFKTFHLFSFHFGSVELFTHWFLVQSNFPYFSHVLKKHTTLKNRWINNKQALVPSLSSLLLWLRSLVETKSNNKKQEEKKKLWQENVLVVVYKLLLWILFLFLDEMSFFRYHRHNLSFIYRKIGGEIDESRKLWPRCDWHFID